MIQPFQTQQVGYRIPLNSGAQKVFDEASGVDLVPEVEDRFEDMAADFLEQWLVSSEDPFKNEPQAQAETQAKTPVEKTPAQSPEKPVTESAPVFEPRMSSFHIGLDWQLSDGRQIS